MRVAGKFERIETLRACEEDGPYVVYDGDTCQECLSQTGAVTVRNKRDQVIWFFCKVCRAEMDLSKSVRVQC